MMLLVKIAGWIASLLLLGACAVFVMYTPTHDARFLVGVAGLVILAIAINPLAVGIVGKRFPRGMAGFSLAGSAIGIISLYAALQMHTDFGLPEVLPTSMANAPGASQQTAVLRPLKHADAPQMVEAVRCAAAARLATAFALENPGAEAGSGKDEADTRLAIAGATYGRMGHLADQYGQWAYDEGRRSGNDDENIFAHIAALRLTHEGGADAVEACIKSHPPKDHWIGLPLEFPQRIVQCDHHASEDEKSSDASMANSARRVKDTLKPMMARLRENLSSEELIYAQAVAVQWENEADIEGRGNDISLACIAAFTPPLTLVLP